MLKQLCSPRTLKYFAAAVSAAFLSLLLVLGGYYRTQSNLAQEKITQSRAYLSQVSERLGNELGKMRSQMVVVCQEPEIISFCTQGASVTRTLQAKQRLQRCGVLGEMVSEAALFFPEQGFYTLTTRQIIPDLSLHYRAGMLTFQQQPVEALISEILKTSKDEVSYHYLPAQEMELYEIGSRRFITYWMRLSVPGSRQQPVALALVDADRISEDIRKLFSEESGLCITDTDGQVLLLSGSQPEGGWIAAGMEGRVKNGTVLSVSPNYPGGLTLSLFLPNSWMQNSIRPLAESIWLYLFLLLILGAAACISAILYNGRPLRRIARQVALATDGFSTGSHAAELGVTRLVDTNRELKSRLTDWEPVVRAGLLERLYKGGIWEDGEMQTVPDFQNSLPNRFCVSVLCWRPYPGGPSLPSSEEILQQVTRLVAQDFDVRFIHPFRMDQVGFVAGVSSGREVLEARIARLLEDLQDFNQLFSIGLGSEQSGLDGIYISCMEARSALGGIPDWSRNRLAWYTPSDQQPASYHFPQEDQNRLAAYVLAGDGNLVQRQLNRIYQRNFVACAFQEDAILRFYQDLRVIYEGCAKQLNLSQPAPEPAVLTQPATVRDAFLAALSEMSSQVGNTRLREANDLMKRILAFVDERYSDSSLSLRMVADAFDMTDKYLSTFFKENAAVKFSEYVEQKRMAEAERLLSETKWSISEIQERVGYATSNTFYKAFKRKYGVSPSAWQKRNLS
ncbi:MAG: helix-turn-helix transcriptional regulator [Provencibacterium sp.]|jgi:two-component system response regulator YesN|nr:helix-turn-helix transcriptional regulator [Provencibacterium sp.]